MESIYFSFFWGGSTSRTHRRSEKQLTGQSDIYREVLISNNTKLKTRKILFSFNDRTLYLIPLTDRYAFGTYIAGVQRTRVWSFLHYNKTGNSSFLIFTACACNETFTMENTTCDAITGQCLCRESPLGGPYSGRACNECSVNAIGKEKYILVFYPKIQ